MAFRLGSFARGFAERAMEYKTEEENEIRDLVKASYMDTLEQTRENRKAVKAKREKLTNIGNELKLMGLTDAQAAGIIGSGTEGAERQLELLRESAKSWGKEFDINNVVSAAEDSGITLEEAVNRTIGELKQSQEPVGLEGDRRRSILGAGKGFAADQFAKYSRQFGEDYATIRSEAKDERVRGELPTVTINQSKLYRPDPLEDIRRRQAEADVKIREGEVARLPDADKLSKVQIQKVEAEIAVLRSQADDDELDLGDVRSTLNVIDRHLSDVIINKSNANLSWSENTGYQTTQKKPQKKRHKH
jgi:antitoxin component HigA of HigAB toxin-antitoxin module